jgi:murein DD-endopeptidase MepM/ murein hydrolase activator NlpD
MDNYWQQPGYLDLLIEIGYKSKRLIMITANKTSFKRTAAGLFLALALFVPFSVMASPLKLLSEGMLFNEPDAFVDETDVLGSRSEALSRSAFFKSTEPGVSEIGSVKTYSLKVVKSLESKDWGKIQKENSASLKENSKCLIRPVHGRISSLFGKRRHPKKRSWHFHAGIDIVARKGTPILASMAGKVTFAGWKRGYGLMLILEHNDGFETVYAHCSRILVKKGQVINTGQKIAKIGSTGVATGSHLHFEVRRNGNVRNPFRYLTN